jgi:hypothetical protein
MMNTILELPIASQASMLANARCIHAMKHRRGVTATEHGVQTLEAYVLGQRRVDMTLDVSMRRAGPLLRITVRGVYREPADLQSGTSLVAPRGGAVLGHGLLPSGSCYVLVRGLSRRAVELWLPGRARPSRQHYHQWATLPESDRTAYHPDTAPDASWWCDWLRQSDEYSARRREEASRIGGHIDVATERALDMWDHSEKRVIRCQPPLVAQAFTCLIVSSTLTRR